jgi:purine-nucleoside phosphorylase
MTIHIGASRRGRAKPCCFPGDPLRAQWAAETFWRDATCVNRVRGMLGFTGTWRGHR